MCIRDSFVIDQRAGGVEHGAVAAQHDHQVALPANRSAVRDFQTVVGNLSGRSLVNQHPQLALTQMVGDLAEGAGEVGIAEFADEANGCLLYTSRCV